MISVVDPATLRALKNLGRHAVEIYSATSHNHTVDRARLSLKNGRCRHIVSVADVDLIDAAGVADGEHSTALQGGAP